MSDKPKLSDPCPAKYRKGKHNIYGSICRDCGAQDEEFAAKVQQGAEQIAARKNFLLACDVLDSELADGGLKPRVELTIAIAKWRSALSRLRDAKADL